MTRPLAAPTATVKGNSWRIVLPSGTAIIPADDETHRQLAHAGINELRPAGQDELPDALYVADSVTLYLASAEWIAEQLDAQIVLIQRLNRLSTSETSEPGNNQD